MPLIMKRKRAKAMKRVTGVAAVKPARKRVSAPAVRGDKAPEAAQREMDQWFEAHIEQVYEAARANTRGLFGREKV